MIETGHLGKMLIGAGTILFIIGAIFLLAGKIPWIGKLPGDICIRKENCTIYLPLATSLIISVVLSVLLNLFHKR